MEKLIDINAAAQYLAVKPQTIRVWVMQRRIPFVKAGSRLRFRLAELERWVEAEACRLAPVPGKRVA